VCAHACVWVSARARGRACASSHVALLIQNATRMRHIVLSFVASLFPPKAFLTLSHKHHDFQEKVTEQNCVFSFSLQFSSKTFLILRRIQRHIVINVETFSYSLLLVTIFRFYWNLNFLDMFSKKSSNIKFHKNLSSGNRVVSCDRTDWQTWRSW
jgi:hypothetical protein